MNALNPIATFQSANPARAANTARRREDRHRRFEALLLRSHAIMRARNAAR